MQYQTNTPQPYRHSTLLGLMYGQQYPELQEDQVELPRGELAAHIEDLCDCV